MDNVSNSAIRPASINIELHLVDGTTSESTTSNVSTEQQYHLIPSVTSSNEASSSVEQLLAAIRQGQEKEGQGNQPVEIPQPESQTLDLEDEKDLPQKLKQRYMCDICGRVFRSRSGFLAHKATVHDNKGAFTCHICGTTMKWEWNLKTHLKAVHNFATKEILKKKKNRICQKCGATFRNNGLLYYHLKKVHKIAKPVSCEVCGKAFETEGAQFYTHRKLHPNHYKFHTCDVCKLMFSTLSGFQKHLSQTGHASNVKGQVKGDGEIRGEITSGKNTEGGHEKTVAEDSTVSGDKEQTDNVQLACPYKCGSVFATYDGYRIHMINKSCHSRIQHQNGKKRKKSERKEQLLCCGKVYESKEEYWEHIEIHKHYKDCYSSGSKQKKYECPMCRTIVDISGLLYHQKKHSGITDYACDQCSYKCILSTDLEKHKLIHSNIKPHRCKFCGRTFRQSSTQREHEQMHVLVKHGVYINCPKCPKRFRLETERRKHQKSCKGAQGHYYNMHALATGSLGYMCNVCLGFFFVKMSFSVHKKNTCYSKGTAEPETEINVQAKTIKIPNESGEGKEVSLENLYLCKVCCQVFENASDYGEHEGRCVMKDRLKGKLNGGLIHSGPLKMDVNHDTHDNTTTSESDGTSDSDDTDDSDETGDSGDTDDSDDTDVNGDQKKADEENHTEVPNQSSKFIIVHPKQTGMRKKKAATCSLISSSITCSTCNKTTDEIIRQECSMHQVSDQTVQCHPVEDHPDGDAYMRRGRVDLLCKTCKKTTERLLLEHKCTPHFYCRECKGVFTCKTGLQRPVKGRKNCDKMLCSYCDKGYQSIPALRFHDQHVHTKVVYKMQETESEAQAQDKKVKQQNVNVLITSKKKVSPKSGTSLLPQNRVPHIVTLKRLPDEDQQNGDKFQAGGHEMKAHKILNVLTENVSRMTAAGGDKQRGSQLKPSMATKNGRGTAGPSKSGVTPCKPLPRKRSSQNDKDGKQPVSSEKVARRAPLVAHQCPFCTKNYSIESNLLVHLRTHGIQMPYQCNYCNKCYAKPRYLTDHMEEKHKEVLGLLKMGKF